MKNIKFVFVLLLALTLSGIAFAEGTSKNGDEFRETAMEYKAEAKKYEDKGSYEIAKLYKRLEDIKLNAADLADQGRWDDIDWTEYHKINKKINKLLHQ